jgi:hypothetical protein
MRARVAYCGPLENRPVVTTGRFSRGPHEACIHDAVFSPLCVDELLERAEGWAEQGEVQEGSSRQDVVNEF